MSSSESFHVQYMQRLPGLRLLALRSLAVPATPAKHIFIHTEPSVSIYHNGWIDLNENGTKDPYEDPAVPVEMRIDDLLSAITRLPAGGDQRKFVMQSMQG
jgi:hypothetical protein